MVFGVIESTVSGAFSSQFSAPLATKLYTHLVYTSDANIF